jgi:hypothetical protein
MSEHSLVLHKGKTFQVPAIIASVGPEATKRFFEFFTAPIRNKNSPAVCAGGKSLREGCPVLPETDHKGVDTRRPLTKNVLASLNPDLDSTRFSRKLL